MKNLRYICCQPAVPYYTWQVEVLINNAGGAFDAATIEDSDPEIWAKTYEVNVTGAVRMAKAMIPLMKNPGQFSVLYPVIFLFLRYSCPLSVLFLVIIVSFLFQDWICLWMLRSPVHHTLSTSVSSL